MHLYETHLPVQSTERSLAFYRDLVGLQLAYRDPSRDIVFLWLGAERRSMLGLWGPSTSLGKQPCKHHLAMAVSLDELVVLGPQLQARRVVTTNFLGEQTTEPSVIGWMPSAQIYFPDPDGHALEYIALLDETPDPSFIGTLSAWRERPGAAGSRSR